jgi:hypothetical protein
MRCVPCVSLVFLLAFRSALVVAGDDGTLDAMLDTFDAITYFPDDAAFEQNVFDSSSAWAVLAVKEFGPSEQRMEMWFEAAAPEGLRLGIVNLNEIPKLCKEYKVLPQHAPRIWVYDQLGKHWPSKVIKFGYDDAGLSERLAQELTAATASLTKAKGVLKKASAASDTKDEM